MGLKKKPVTGMKDILPDEMAVRQYLLSEIRKCYREFGFTEIETPAVEHIENLLSRQGGDNEKLIFKLLKRGEKLEHALSSGEASALSDSGLRYDLTLPLTRFYAENQAKLPNPFKALQIGPVFRADRPQKGRFREFVQCDIDILGDESNLSEIELILAIGSFLRRIGFSGRHPFRIVLNDREILRGMQRFAGFPEEDFEEICVILDKADKIGTEGVREELLSLGLSAEGIDRYLSLVLDAGEEAEDIRRLGEILGEKLSPEISENLSEIMEMVREIAGPELRLSFDPTLVRGMGYYTGPIFEIRAEGFPGSIGGGGRYDRMVGLFTGKDTAAVGFSIGFERLVTILLESGEETEREEGSLAILLEKGISREKLSAALREADSRRERGERVLIVRMNKNKKFQKEQLRKEGYRECMEIYA